MRACTRAFARGSIVVLLGWAGSATALQIVIDHETGAQSFNGVAEVARGETVEIVVEKTFSPCFLYNASQIRQDEAERRAGAPADPKRVSIKTTHQRGVSSYLVKIEARPNAPAALNCAKNAQNLQAGTWTVPVATVGYTLEFSGGLVVDGLTDKKYSLQPISGTANYSVARDRSAEDKTNQRLALFAHLVDTRKQRNSEWTWVPLTVGIGFDDKARYMFGTGAKFGDQWYVTVGAVTGKRSTLPVGVTEGMSTTNQNLLSTMGSKSATSWFVSITFNFLGTQSRSGFDSLMPTPAPQKSDSSQ